MFQRTAGKLLSPQGIDALIDFLARHPAAGDVIEGTGGIRKLRWRLPGRGKRGGARVIYYFHSDVMPLLLLVAYAKSAASDISVDERRRIKAIVEDFVKMHLSKRPRI